MVQNEDFLFHDFHLDANGFRHIYCVECSICDFMFYFSTDYNNLSNEFLFCNKIQISQLHHIYEVNNTPNCSYILFPLFFLLFKYIC